MVALLALMRLKFTLLIPLINVAVVKAVRLSDGSDAWSNQTVEAPDCASDGNIVYGAATGGGLSATEELFAVNAGSGQELWHEQTQTRYELLAYSTSGHQGYRYNYLGLGQPMLSAVDFQNHSVLWTLPNIELLPQQPLPGGSGCATI